MTTRLANRSASSDSADLELHCPLCEYNLRGLSEPRCPECGYRFDWDELRRLTLQEREFFFEHHRRGLINAFFRTAAQTTRPRRFWRYLQPAVPYSSRLLVVYASVVTLLAILPLAAQLARSSLAGLDSTSINLFWLRRFLEHTFPGITWFVLVGAFEAMHRSATIAVASWIIAGLLWPVLTFIGLLVFQVSMWRARIKLVHVARCVVYSADGLIWAGMLCTLIVAILNIPLVPVSAGNTIVAIVAAATYGLAILVLAYRLICAYRLYLRFDRPFATVLSVQIMVGLMMFLLFLIFVAELP